MKTFSSVQTFFMKVLLPLVVISFLVLSELGSWLKAHNHPLLWNALMWGKPNALWPPSPMMQILFPLIGGVVSLYVVVAYTGLKRVRGDSHFFYVSNFLREIAVPVGQVSAVMQTKWDPRFAKLVLSETSIFGREIKFMLPLRVSDFLCLRRSRHPVVDEMNKLADAGTARRP